MITDSQIINVSHLEHLQSELNLGVDGEQARSLLHTIKTSCKSVPYSDEATLDARTKFFGLWYQLGPPSIFFTVAPGDECSFRVQLYSNPAMQQLPFPTMSESACIGNIVLRAKLRMENPGACAREFNSLMEIIMECLIGWDVKRGKQTRKGIFGEVLGWADATEEQARKSLHSHMLLFIANFDRLIIMLWSDKEEIRECAKEELLAYFKQVMCSTYDIMENEFDHDKPTRSNCRYNSEGSTATNWQQIEHCNNSTQNAPHIMACTLQDCSTTANEMVFNLEDVHRDIVDRHIKTVRYPKRDLPHI
jgi:hypothetical protein